MSFSVEFVQKTGVCSYSNVYKVHHQSGPNDHDFTVQSWAGKCCATNIISGFGYIITNERMREVIDWLKTNPFTQKELENRAVWPMRVFHLYVGKNYNYPWTNPDNAKYFPEISLLAEFPQRAHAGGPISIYQIDLGQT